MPFLLKCQSTAAGRHMVKCRVSGALLIVHAADPPAIQAPSFPIGSTGRNHAGAVTDIGANLAAVLQGPQGRRSGNGRGSPGRHLRPGCGTALRPAAAFRRTKSVHRIVWCRAFLTQKTDLHAALRACRRIAGPPTVGTADRSPSDHSRPCIPALRRARAVRRTQSAFRRGAGRGVCLKSSSRAGKRFRPPAYGDSVSAQRSTGSRVPEAATASRFTALGASVFHRLRPDVGVGSRLPDAATTSSFTALDASAVRRLRPGAVLGADAPMR